MMQKMSKNWNYSRNRVAMKVELRTVTESFLIKSEKTLKFKCDETSTTSDDVSMISIPRSPPSPKMCLSPETNVSFSEI